MSMTASFIGFSPIGGDATASKELSRTATQRSPRKMQKILPSQELAKD